MMIPSIPIAQTPLQLGLALSLVLAVALGCGKKPNAFPALASQEVNCLALSPDGKTLATGEWDKSLRLWDAASGKELAVLRESAAQDDRVPRVCSVAFSPDGKTLAAGEDRGGAVQLWDLETRRVRGTLAGSRSGIAVVALSPDGKTLAAGYQMGPGGESETRLWEPATGKQADRVVHKGQVICLGFSPDGGRLAQGYIYGADGYLKVYELAARKESVALTVRPQAVAVLAFSPDGKLLVTGQQNGNVVVRQAATGEWVRMLVEHARPVSSIRFAPDGKTWATGSEDGTVILWDGTTRNVKSTFNGHTAAIRAIWFAPDGATLLTASGDRVLKRWDAATGEEITGK
jgi:WD40 repeat protein